MININYYRTHHRVTIKGHSESAPKGEDLICAAVTILARTLATACVNAECDNRMRGVEVKLEPGDAEIKCAPTKKLHALTLLTFDNICAGFELLAKQYPDYVAFHIF